MDILNFFAYCLAIYIIYKTVRWLVGKIKIKNIKGRSILITGCDTGFGHDAAIRFSQIGFQVFAGCYVKETLAYFDSYSPKGGSIIPFQLDVSNEQSVKDAGVFVRSKLPKGKGLWAILNNAGLGPPVGPIQMLRRKHYESRLAVNLFGPIEVTREFLPLVQAERGRVINTSSGSGRISLTRACAYSISKYGVEAFSDCLRREMYHFGVSVHIIEPGFFKTNMCTYDFFKESMQNVYEEAPPEVKKLYGANYMEKSLQKTREELRMFCSSDTDLVVDAYVHAATSIAPHIRYPVGWFAIIVMKMVSLLPDRLLDHLTLEKFTD